jgi:uncharacterized protein (TIGR03067 family)
MYRVTFVLATAAGLIAFALAAQAHSSKPVDGKLPGQWSVLTVKHKGGEELMLIGFGIPWVIQDDKLSLPRFEEGKVGEGRVLGGPDGQLFTYKLLPEPGERARAIDLTLVAGRDKVQVSMGIYALSGNELRICFNPPGRPRPTAFAVPADSDTVLMILKR